MNSKLLKETKYYSEYEVTKIENVVNKKAIAREIEAYLDIHNISGTKYQLSHLSGRSGNLLINLYVHGNRSDVPWMAFESDTLFDDFLYKLGQDIGEHINVPPAYYPN